MLAFVGRVVATALKVFADLSGTLKHLTTVVLRQWGYLLCLSSYGTVV